MTTLAATQVFRPAATILEAFLSDAAANGQPSRGWSALSVPRGLYEVLARDRASQEEARYLIVAGGLLGTASGAWLRLLMKGFFNLDFLTATFTRGLLRLTNTGGVAAVQRAANASWAVTNDARALLYRNVDGFSIGGTLGDYVDVTYQAESTGTTYNVAPGSIVALSTPIPGITVTSPAAAATGTWITTAAIDDETEAAAKVRCLNRWATTGAGGGRGAVASWLTDAFTAAGISPTITRYSIDDANPFGAGSVGVYVANAAGPATVAELALLDAYVQLRKGLGTTTWTVASGAGYAQPAAGIIYHQGNATALADAVAALGVLAAAHPMGPANLYADDVKEAVLSVPGVYQFAMTTPTPESVIALPANSILSFDTSALVVVSGTP